MLTESFEQAGRDSRRIDLKKDLVVIGGGLAGTCTAVAAARGGSTVVLVQDRPVLGGNASSEVRLWALGATSHMGNNNRWSREGGIIGEILLENLHRNREGNPLLLDTILLEIVRNEKNITLLLNTAVYRTEKHDKRRIKSVSAFCSQNSTEYDIEGELFCDASGDGIVAFGAGAGYRFGAESREEFGEKLAPKIANSEMLGHTLYFYSKSTGAPVKYVPPAFALADITSIPRYKILTSREHGCRLWWIEYGGDRDTVYETEEIKWELWRIVYGIWDHIKNSGEFEDVEDLTLEWVGAIPGKRESRRFEGHYMLKQRDIVEQLPFEDAVAHGGWAIDIHPSDGVYSERPPCVQWHSKGVYQIPYRCYVSKDMDNLFFAGRIMSSSHIAFGSTRVMLTCAIGAQAVGQAAAMCRERQILPSDIQTPVLMKELQNRLNENGQSIPGVPIDKSADPIGEAHLSASTTYSLTDLPFDGPWLSLDVSVAALLPLKKSAGLRLGISVRAEEQTRLLVELRVSSNESNYTPDVKCKSINILLDAGINDVSLDFSDTETSFQYGFVTFMKVPGVSIRCSSERVSGLATVFNKSHKSVSNNGSQKPDDDSGIDGFEFWTPRRSPDNHLIAMRDVQGLAAYTIENVRNGFTRPWISTNAWVAASDDAKPKIQIRWDRPMKIGGLRVHLDTDFDHALESSLMLHPEDRIQFCVEQFEVKDSLGNVLFSIDDNHQTIVDALFESEISTDELILEFLPNVGYSPTSVFEISALRGIISDQ